jgi:hypothetical protein
MSIKSDDTSAKPPAKSTVKEECPQRRNLLSKDEAQRLAVKHRVRRKATPCRTSQRRHLAIATSINDSAAREIVRRHHNTHGVAGINFNFVAVDAAAAFRAHNSAVLKAHAKIRVAIMRDHGAVKFLIRLSHLLTFQRPASRRRRHWVQF